MAATAEMATRQCLDALQKGNDTRIAGAAAKRDVKAGLLTVVAALDDERAQVLPIIDLLMAQNRWGRNRALRVLSPQMIAENRRVRDLTDRQRRVIVTALSR